MPLLESFLSLFRFGAYRRKRPAGVKKTLNEPSAQVPANSQAEGGYLTGAHDFVLHNAKFFSISSAAKAQALRYLEDQADRGAEIDSSERFPPPKCHPFTRQKLLNRLSDWREDKRCDGELGREGFEGAEANVDEELDDDDDELDNKTEDQLLADASVLGSKPEIKPPPDDKCFRSNWNMLWVLGPAGVGKSALAQTFAEICRNATLAYVAAFFFSRPNRRDNPSTVIPTLIAQLMAQIPKYRRFIIETLVADPKIVMKSVDFQFKRLLVEPLDSIHSKKSFQRPILIILDGLDECAGEGAQTDFIRLIGNHVRLRRSSPILWMVFSRPEWHLKQMLSDPDFDIRCHRVYISADDKEAKRDTRLVLRFGLQEIRQKFSDRLPSEWPGEGCIRILGRGSRGLFIIAVTILSFIGDKTFGRPTERLQACIDRFTESECSGSLDKANPYAALDLLYEQILNDIPSNILSTAMQIICLRILYLRNNLCVSLHANVLGLDRERFYHVLTGMHSILLIPPLEYADRYGIQFHHASFPDYLKDRTRSTKYFFACSTGYAGVAAACLRWYDAFINDNCSFQGTSKCTSPIPPLSWPPGFSNDSVNSQTVIDQVQDVVFKTAWEACCQVDSSDAPKVVEMFSNFHFCHLTTAVRNEQQLIPFFNWLYHHGDRKGVILRQTPSPASISEMKLAFKVGVRIPLNIFPLRKSHHRFEFVSSHGMKKPSKREQAAAFFLGSGEQACLVRILFEGDRNEQGLHRLSVREHALGSLKLKI